MALAGAVNDRQLFQATLGLKAPWFVSEVKLDKAKKHLDIFIDFEQGARFPCPDCKALCEVYDTSQRTWRHLNFSKYEAYLHARVPRTKCPGHWIFHLCFGCCVAHLTLASVPALIASSSAFSTTSDLSTFIRYFIRSRSCAMLSGRKITTRTIGS
jgi:hypothetical protein